ncbi:MMPL family transporter [Streptomyces yaizuensis]|uniref:MMPL family transporter n=1 Tax=Streptomyces yaizuensis TaxID=2989713 RepID=A0ABQ5P2I9_9ACTN|nr:MMPL family transporter [Streptomyces sp. YSPA8]GLF96727.1 MMPL family transporter [Streptomyces sp. YSPA8]
MPATPSTLHRLGAFAAARRRTVLIAGAVLFLLAAAFGAGAQAALSLSRFEAPGSESATAERILHEEFQDGSPNYVLLVTAKDGRTVDDPEVAAEGRKLAEDLSVREGVDTVGSFWSRGENSPLVSEDRSQALVVAWLRGPATEVRAELAGITPDFTRDTALLTVRPGGQDEVFRQVGEETRRDFLRAEAVVVPAVLLLLLWVYRRWSAAGLTLGVGFFSVLATLAVLRGVTAFTEVSTFAANLALVLGLGLGLDYALFVISRFREEMAATPDGTAADRHAAVARTVARAGRTVLFSGFTVAAALAALFLFPFPFLRSFAWAGIAVVVSAAFGAVVLLPAALAATGRRTLRPARTGPAVESGRWYRTTLRIMRRPLLYGLPVLVVLLALGAPFLGARFGLPDERVLPASASSRIVQEEIRSGFAAEETDALHVVTTGEAAGNTGPEYAQRLSRLPGVFQVDTGSGTYRAGARVGATSDPGRFEAGGHTRLTVVPDQEALAGDMARFVERVRAVDAPYTEVRVGGFPAAMTDFRGELLDRLPYVVALILLVTFAILFLMTGSLLIPLKATVANVLSLSVMFGVLVWVFQDGNLSGLLGFTATGRMEPSIPILMFCVAYGLSMDYEVFIMARIKEAYDRTGDNTSAVAEGIQRSAPLVTSAAAILALTFAAYATGGVVFLKQLGIGMALAVLVDALLIRTLLVPAFMGLAGGANWWAPAPLRRLHARYGISEAPRQDPIERHRAGDHSDRTAPLPGDTGKGRHH